MFDVEPSTDTPTDDSAAPPQCVPPSAETVALLNASEARVSADDGVEGAVEESGKAAAAEGGQKVTPWEVEVSEASCRRCILVLFVDGHLWFGGEIAGLIV